MTGDCTPVSQRQPMLAGMRPALKDGEYHFCSTKDPSVAAAAGGDSLSIFREDEGTTFVLGAADAGSARLRPVNANVQDRVGSIFRA